MIGKNRGMGQDCMSYAELTSNLQQCNQTDVSSQFACAQNNMNAQQAISNLQIAYQDCVPTSITPPSPSASSVAPVQWVTDPNTGNTNLQVVPVNYVASPLSQVTNTTPIVPVVTPTNTLSIRLLNITKGTDATSNGVFTVGDNYSVVISGAGANSPVVMGASQNGNSLGQISLGSTNSSGTLTYSGVMDLSTVGSWVESCLVANPGVQKSITFTVSATPSVPIVTTNSTANQSVNSALSNNAGAQNTTNSTAGQNDGTTAGLDIGTWLEETFSVAGVNVPYWAVGAAGLGLVLIMMGMSGRR
jgi:hypothetical protein